MVADRDAAGRRQGGRVTRDELAAALPGYTAGIEAELSLLRQLLQLAHAQHDASRTRDLGDINRTGDERERIMAALVNLEHELKPVRLAIAAQKELAETIEGFGAITDLHRTAATVVSDILQADRNTLNELRTAELARRTSAQAVETGEATLAAYRRVLTPVIGSAGLVNRRG
jgi:hypothetical protein